ncbi:hypothetical protein, partial [Kitasatospora sp. NPDC047058]|uniref:hypothetical protein n=1 Tax=Kitasatospora sp. NPDC047058 TaxID=3155620 RepID=UPI0033D6FE26
MGDRLGGAAVCLAGTVALLGALWKVLRDRGRRSGPPLHYGYVCSALIGAGMTVGAPAAAPVLCSVV